MARNTRGLGPSIATGTATTTVTLENQPPLPTPTLTLELRRKKKKVTWKEGTVDNEFLQKKSSKKCCIFHKEKSFDEDDSDEDDRSGQGHNHDHDHGHSDGCCSKNDDGASSSQSEV